MKRDEGIQAKEGGVDSILTKSDEVGRSMEKDIGELNFIILFKG